MKAHTEAVKLRGPSLADSPRDFHDRYGSDISLLAMQNRLLASNFNTATNAGRGARCVAPRRGSARS